MTVRYLLSEERLEGTWGLEYAGTTMGPDGLTYHEAGDIIELLPGDQLYRDAEGLRAIVRADARRHPDVAAAARACITEPKGPAPVLTEEGMRLAWALEGDARRLAFLELIGIVVTPEGVVSMATADGGQASYVDLRSPYTKMEQLVREALRNGRDNGYGDEDDAMSDDRLAMELIDGDADIAAACAHADGESLDDAAVELLRQVVRDIRHPQEAAPGPLRLEVPRSATAAVVRLLDGLGGSTVRVSTISDADWDPDADDGPEFIGELGVDEHEDGVVLIVSGEDEDRGVIVPLARVACIEVLR